jgi:D-mannonate dehydratase (UxuA)
VCKQYDVKMAAHPYDPPGLPFGYEGAENWDSPSVFDAYKRYESIVDIPYNGFRLCLGTTAEGLRKPAMKVSLLSNTWVVGAKYIKFICVISAEVFTISRKFTPTKERWIFSKLCESLEMCNLASRLVLITCQATRTILASFRPMHSGTVISTL